MLIGSQGDLDDARTVDYLTAKVCCQWAYSNSPTSALLAYAGLRVAAHEITSIGHHRSRVQSEHENPPKIPARNIEFCLYLVCLPVLYIAPQ